MIFNITEDLVKNSISFTDLARKLGKNPHSRITKILKVQLAEQKISYEHFSKSGLPKREDVKKICPICGDEFLIPKNNRKTQMTCSYSCSNRYFSDRRNKPKNYKNYRTICFHHHEKKCVICEERNIVEVHHFDENKKNNSPTNLVPMCPTHHQYWHSKYRNLIVEKVESYLKDFEQVYKVDS